MVGPDKDVIFYQNNYKLEINPVYELKISIFKSQTTSKVVVLSLTKPKKD